MSYYTMDNLEQFFAAMIDDITQIDKDWNVKTSNGKTSPIERLVCMAYDREYEDFCDTKDQEGKSFTEEEAYNYAFHGAKEEAMHWLIENIEGDDPLDYLNEQLGTAEAPSHRWINFDQLTPETNLFQYIGLLPLPWVHENIIKKNHQK